MKFGDDPLLKLDSIADVSLESLKNFEKGLFKNTAGQRLMPRGIEVK